MKRCRTSGKVRFSDPVSAYLRIASTPFALKQRAYQCPDCHSWHLTKREPKKHYGEVAA